SEGTSIGRRTFRTFVRLCIAVATGVGATIAWQYHSDDIKEIARTWAPSPGGLSSGSAMTSPPGPASLAAITPESVPPQPPVARDLADAPPGVDQPPAKQEQLPAAREPPVVTQQQPAATPQQDARKGATPQPAAARDLAGVRPGADQLPAKQEQLSAAREPPVVTQEQPAARQQQVARSVATPQPTIARDVAGARPGVDQPPAKQEQLPAAREPPVVTQQ